MKTTLTRKEARKLALAGQGLLNKQPFGRGKSGALKALQQLGYVQIDTIAVIARAHHHTLWSRSPNYTPGHLEVLQAKERKVFEYWSHAVAYLPMSDYRFCLPRMRAIAGGQKHWHAPDKKLMAEVYARIAAEGPLMAKDFAPPENHKSAGWWEWKPAKRALEQLFMEGKLMATRRVNFHKVYDLAERVLPPGFDTSVPTPEEASRFLIQRAIRANGLATEAEICYLRRGVRASVRAQLRAMLHDNEIVAVNVSGLDNQIYYTTEAQLNVLPRLRLGKSIHLLSPFDNLVIQRKRVQQLFDFDYQIECYVPQPKRVYGYFCLPVLWGDRFIARLDPKADRKAKTFRVRKLIFEPAFQDFDLVVEPLVEKIRELAAFNQCEKIVVESVWAEAKPKAWLIERLRHRF